MAPLFLGISGGVDSAVAAARLIDDGHDVVAVHLLLLDSTDDEARERVDRVCRRLQLPLIERDVSDLFRQEVVDPFLATYRRGETPNPCVRCNERVKFRSLLECVTDGLDRIATGHYAKIVTEDERLYLARGADRQKDQSYALYRLDPEGLRRLLLPLGMSTKVEILREARDRFGDIFDDVAESNDLCFLSADRRRALLRGSPGPIVDGEGRRLGEHDGLGLYTVGQRKGLGLAGGPWFVLEIDERENRIVVGRNEISLAPSVSALSPRWFRRPSIGQILSAQHRYRAPTAQIRVDHVDDEGFTVTYLDPPQPVAPGQSLVLYEEERVLGGGIIAKQKEAKTGP